uniref:Maestro heat-like repeat-containing protein family member 2B isoform X2 n=1 Tax=Pogona vitticeps TaxID=103695 RepID=A0ABM5EYN9_9SAUR
MESALCDLQAEVPPDPVGASARLAKIPGLLDLFCSHLPTTMQYGLEEVLMEAISTLAHQHLDTIVSHLLRQWLPLASGTSRIWRHLGGDPSLALLILPKLLSFMTQLSILGTISCPGREELEEEVWEKHFKATCAMYEVLLGLHMEVMVQSVFPQLLYCLPEQVKSWGSFGDPATRPEGLRMLTRCLLQTGMLKGVLIQRVLPWMQSESPKLRLLGTTILAEVIPLSGKGKIQLRAFLPVLKESAEDQQPDICLMALRSLGRLLFWAPVEEDDCVREAAFHLFVVLATWAKWECLDFFVEQVKKNLVPLLVHQSDPNRKVLEACRGAFPLALDFVAGKRLQQLYKRREISSTKIILDLCQQLRPFCRVSR